MVKFTPDMKLNPFSIASALLSISFLVANAVSAADLFLIDFEDYSVGNLVDAQPPQSEMFRWQAPKGAAEVQTNVVHSGKHALRMGPNRSLAQRRFDGGEGIRSLAAMTQ